MNRVYLNLKTQSNRKQKIIIFNVIWFIKLMNICIISYAPSITKHNIPSMFSIQFSTINVDCVCLECVWYLQIFIFEFISLFWQNLVQYLVLRQVLHLYEILQNLLLKFTFDSFYSTNWYRIWNNAMKLLL